MGKNSKQRGGQVSAGAPLQYFDPKYQQPSAPAGQNVGNPTSPLVVRPGLLQQSGGFYPSIMGGVIQNAGLLVPVAARQGMTLFSKYKNSKKTRRSRKARKQTRKLRKQTRKA
jgi:hypothetical protein